MIAALCVLGSMVAPQLAVHAQSDSYSVDDLCSSISSDDVGKFKKIMHLHPEWASVPQGQHQPVVLATITYYRQHDPIFLKYLLSHNANLQVYSREGIKNDWQHDWNYYYTNLSPLLVAVNAHDAALVKVLLAAGASPAGVAGTPDPLSAMMSTWQGNRPFRTGDDGGTKLYDVAQYQRDIAVARALIQARMKAHLQPSGDLLRQAAPVSFEVTKMLIAAGAPVNEPDADGNTALHCALHAVETSFPYTQVAFARDLRDMRDWMGNDREADVIALLAKSGARLDARNNKGETALFRAVSAPAIVSYHASDLPKWCDLTLSPIRVLLSAGANPNTASNDQLTPLHVAVQTGNTEAIKLLLAHHANVKAEDADGRTPYDIAYMNHDNDIMALLAKYGGKSD